MRVCLQLVPLRRGLVSLHGVVLRDVLSGALFPQPPLLRCLVADVPAAKPTAPAAAIPPWHDQIRGGGGEISALSNCWVGSEDDGESSEQDSEEPVYSDWEPTVLGPRRASVVPP